MIKQMILLAAFSSSAAFADDALTQSLLGSRWKGDFGKGGETLPISLRFQRALSAKGELLYFHHLDGDATDSKALGTVDKACPFTPRALKLDPKTTPVSGTISVFPCAKSELEEARQGSDPDRKAAASLPVKSVELSPDGNSLHIVVQMGPLSVDYHLTRQVPPPETAHPSDEPTATAE